MKSRALAHWTSYGRWRFILSGAALALFAAGCVSVSDWHTVRGSGNVVTEERPVSGFDRVTVSGAGQLTVTQGDTESLTIQTDDNLLPYIQSEVRGGQLSIGPQNVSMSPSRTIRYQLQVKTLRELHLSGSMQAEAPALRTDRLQVAISGSGRVTISQLQTGTFSTHVSGSGDISAAGQAESQTIHITGSGNHHARDLQCARAEVHISGSGNAAVWVSDSLTVHVSGSGHIQYRGRPAVESHVSGSGGVRPMERE